MPGASHVFTSVRANVLRVDAHRSARHAGQTRFFSGVVIPCVESPAQATNATSDQIARLGAYLRAEESRTRPGE